MSLQTIQAALDLLRTEVQADSSVLSSFKQSMKALFPNATILKTEEEVKQQKQAIAGQRQKEKEAGNEDAAKDSTV